MQRWRREFVCRFAEHRTIERIDEIFRFLGANDQDATVNQEPRNAGQPSATNLTFAYQNQLFDFFAACCLANVFRAESVRPGNVDKNLLLANVQTLLEER